MNLLTPRDKEVIESLHSYGLLTTNQLRELHFSRVSKQTLQRRLSVLQENNWIHHITGYYFGEYVWKLTTKAAKLLCSEFVIRNVNRNTLYHDCLSNDLRILVEQNLDSNQWTSSHYLKHRAVSTGLTKENIPDWLCVLNTKLYGPISAAIELELNLKSRTRMLETLNSHRRRESCQLIWYVLPNERFGEKIFRDHQNFFKNMPKAWLCYSVFDELKRHFLDSNLYFNHRSLPLKEFMCLKQDPVVTSVVPPNKDSEKFKLEKIE